MVAAGSGWAAKSWVDAKPFPFWLDRSDRPAPRPELTGQVDADLAIVGGGFTGLWTAILAKERQPDRDVVLIDADRIGSAASGRNGGFCAASLTHGEANGRTRFGEEYDTLHELGIRNLDQIGEAVSRYGIDCDYRRTGDLTVATEQYQVAGLRAAAGDFLDRDAVRAELNSPTFLAASWDRNGTALVDPARLAWGLARAAEDLGVRIYEGTEVIDLGRESGRVVLSASRVAGAAGVAGRGAGAVRARRVALATSAFRPLLARLRLFTVPVYDYVLMSEPLSTDQLESIGWKNRPGVSDSANQFHYYRLTEDNRILWGGYDAIYYRGGRVKPSHDQRPATFAKLAQQFFETFPQLTGLTFSHRWGGAIDTCTRFCAFYGMAFSGQVSYALGYTGLGVGASRFGAQVMLDLLAGEPTERSRLQMVTARPLPFPPEPLAYAGIEITRRSLARADAVQGRRNAWLRVLDRAGLGFDS